MRIFACALLLPVPMLLLTLPAPAQNAATGKAQFNQRCQSCHSGAPGNKMGPDLAGVVGRKAATTNFAYSDAMKKSGLTWDAATLDTYLTAPTALVPGGKMPLGVPDAKVRADIIAYLQTR